MTEPVGSFWNSDVILLCAVAAVPFVVLGGVAIGADAFASGTAASWVQAVGSLFALGIAIYVPYSLHIRDLHSRRESDIARAHVVAASVQLLIEPAVGFLKAFLERAENVDPKFTTISAREWLTKCNQLIKPTYDQLLLLEPGSREMAVALARGFNHVEQMNRVFSRWDGKTDVYSATRDILRLVPIAADAAEQLQKASGLMGEFMSLIEGPDTTAVSNAEV